MRKISLLIFSMLLSFGLSKAQVGINTKTPQGVFHIDGKGDTSGNSNISDDILIDNNGNVGIGTLTPTAKVHSVGSSTVAPMRITDGNQAQNYILVSDANGNASWMEKPSPGGVIYSIVGSKITYALNTYYLVKAMPISVSGNYMISIRWWGYATAVSSNNYTCAVFYATNSANASNNWTSDQTNLKDQAEYCANTLARAFTSFSTTLFAKATKGQYLKLYIRVSSGGSWVIGGVDANQKLWNPSIVVFRV